jgi:hypothetical protein
MAMAKLLCSLLILLCSACQRPQLPPMIAAARAGDAETVRRLAAEGADVNIGAGREGWTPLLHAIHVREDKMALLLIDLGADVNLKAEHLGTTPLMMAAGYGNAQLVEDLLERGADPYLRNSKGGTALSAAVSGVTDIDNFTYGQCQTETVRALLKRAPDVKANPHWFTCDAVASLLK